jgi:hypothetical protein
MPCLGYSNGEPTSSDVQPSPETGGVLADSEPGAAASATADRAEGTAGAAAGRPSERATVSKRPPRVSVAEVATTVRSA